LKSPQFKVGDGAAAVWRLIGRLGAIMLSVTICALFMPSIASASGDLSSIILSTTEPGFVPLPLGNQNGPITRSNVDLVTGTNTDATSQLGQSLADGSITAYIRTWVHQPGDGDAIAIDAYEFKYASEENSFLDGLENELQSESGSEPFTVSGIPGASGSVLHTSSSGTPVSEYSVSFAKGDTVFQVVVATSSGDQASVNATSLASQQFTAAPDNPAAKSGTDGALSGTNWHWVGGLPLVGLLLSIAIFVIGRRRSYPVSLRGPLPWGDGKGGPSAIFPPGPRGGSWSPTGPTYAGQQPQVGAEQWR
jgi:hypothetical protein